MRDVLEAARHDHAAILRPLRLGDRVAVEDAARLVGEHARERRYAAQHALELAHALLIALGRLLFVERELPFHPGDAVLSGLENGLEVPVLLLARVAQIHQPLRAAAVGFTQNRRDLRRREAAADAGDLPIQRLVAHYRAVEQRHLGQRHVERADPQRGTDNAARGAAERRPERH